MIDIHEIARLLQWRWWETISAEAGIVGTYIAVCWIVADYLHQRRVYRQRP